MKNTMIHIRMNLKDEVEASHILLKTVDDNNKPLSDKEKAEAKKKAEEALKEVKSGEDFAKVAKIFTRCFSK